MPPEGSDEPMKVGLYMAENGPPLVIGEPTGENPKFCWNGPAEDMIGSFSRLNVSRLKGT